MDKNGLGEMGREGGVSTGDEGEVSGEVGGKPGEWCLRSFWERVSN